MESRDEYIAEGICWVPPRSARGTSKPAPSSPRSASSSTTRWTRSSSRTRLCAGTFDELPRPAPPRPAPPRPRRLGELVDLISGIGLGSVRTQRRTLWVGLRVLPGRLRLRRRQKGRRVLDATSVVKYLVAMIEPAVAKSSTPLGSGGMFVQLERFVELPGGRHNDIAVYDQEPYGSEVWRRIWRRKPHLRRDQSENSVTTEQARQSRKRRAQTAIVALASIGVPVVDRPSNSRSADRLLVQHARSAVVQHGG